MTTAKTNRPITVIHSFFVLTVRSRCRVLTVSFALKRAHRQSKTTIILAKSFFICLRCIRHTTAMIYPSLPPFRVSDAAYDALVYFFFCKRRFVPFYDGLSPVGIQCIVRHQLDKLVPPLNIDSRLYSRRTYLKTSLINSIAWVHFNYTINVAISPETFYIYWQ